MITLRELGYVNAFASKAPYPGDEYVKIALEKLKQSFIDYNNFYMGKEYDLILSNAEQLTFEILNSNICHMLGIDYKNLISGYFDELIFDVLKFSNSPTSYKLLSELIENQDDVLKFEKESGKKVYNYYKIMIKTSIFEKLSDFSKFNFGVINFNKDEYNRNSSVSFGGNTKKFLYMQTNESVAPYFMIGILPNSVGPNYVVETSIAPSNPYDYFNNQEVVIPTNILVTTQHDMSKQEATPEEKIALLNQYKSIISEYNLPNKLNIYGDYESILVDSSKNRVRK